jgi:hypothetical protein
MRPRWMAAPEVRSRGRRVGVAEIGRLGQWTSSRLSGAPPLAERFARTSIAMTTFTLDLPEELVQRMRMAGDEDWSTIARTAFESYLKRAGGRDDSGPLSAAIDRLRADKAKFDQGQATASYGHGYAWARDRAEFRDLRAIVDAPDYLSAADVVRRSKAFSQQDEFGDAAYPSDEMWEAFVDGATALFNDVAGEL